jgi:hypothetical protein
MREIIVYKGNDHVLIIFNKEKINMIDHQRNTKDKNSILCEEKEKILLINR